MSRSNDPCGTVALCSWKTATLLTNAGRPTTPFDLCIAIGGSGEPCGRKAVTRLAKKDENPDDVFPGQPFCDAHLKQVLDAAFEILRTRGYEPSSLIRTARDLQREVDELRAKNRTREKRQFRRDWVYFCQIDDVVKIGHSVNVEPRIRSFASYGHTVRLLAIEAGGRALEGRLHRKFAEHQSTKGHSRELFNMTPEIMDYIYNGRTCANCTEKALPTRTVCAFHEPARYDPEDLVQLHMTVVAPS
jgi:hypothetical protein